MTRITTDMMFADAIKGWTKEPTKEDPILSAYAVLGISEGASSDDIYESYVTQKAQYHPDVVGVTLSDVLMNSGEDEFNRLVDETVCKLEQLEKAYEELSKRDRDTTKCRCGKIEDCGVDEGTSIVCAECGFVFADRNIHQGADWNCFRDGNGVANMSGVRCHVNRDVENPYDDGAPLMFPAGWKSTFVDEEGNKRTINMEKRNMWYISYKQKAFHLVGKKFEIALHRLGAPKAVCAIAKKLWHEVMESGRVSRGKNRRGLIANCVVYACRNQGVPRSVEDVADAFQIESSEITRGHKIFKEIMSGSEYECVMYETGKQNYELFVKHIQHLGLPFKMAIRCGELLEKHSEVMGNVAPQSRIGGILAWVVHCENKLKKPNKKQICTVVGVCSPTLKKVVDILTSIEK